MRSYIRSSLDLDMRAHAAEHAILELVNSISNSFEYGKLSVIIILTSYPYKLF